MLYWSKPDLDLQIYEPNNENVKSDYINGLNLHNIDVTKSKLWRVYVGWSKTNKKKYYISVLNLRYWIIDKIVVVLDN